MAPTASGSTLTYLRFVAAAWADDRRTDADLLRAFAADRDDRAFTALVGRHAGLVWSVCRRGLGDTPDADDAFQTTFLALAKATPRLPAGGSVGGWLYRVAQRVAAKHRAADARRRAVEQGTPPVDRPAPADAELQAALDEELARLPEKYRGPLVMCVLEGRTYRDAAADLGCSRTAVLRRLQAGQEALRRRLVRRGVALGVGGVTGVLAAVGGAAARPPARLQAAAVDRVMVEAAAGRLGPTLVHGLLGSVASPGVLKALAGVLTVAGLVAVGWAGVRAITAAGPVGVAPANPGTPAVPPAVAEPAPGLVTRVGGPPYPPHLRRAGEGTAAFAPDHKTLYSAHDDAVVRWDPVSGRDVERFPGPAAGHGVAVSADGRRLAVSGKDEVWVWNLGAAGPARVRVVRPEPPGVRVVALSADGGLLASGTHWKDGIDVHAVADGALVAVLDGHAARLAFSPDGKTLASADRSRYRDVTLWDVPTRTRRAVLTSTDRPSYHPHHGKVMGFAFSPDGKTLVTLDSRFTAPERVEAAAGRRIAADDLGGMLQAWDAATGKRAWAVDTTFSLNGAVRFAGPGGPLVEAGAGAVRFRDPATGRPVRPPVDCPDFNHPLLVSPDGGRVVAAWSGGVWDLATGKSLRPEAPAGEVTAVAFSPDGKSLATVAGGTCTAVQVWDATTGGLRRHLKTAWQSQVFTPAVAYPAADRVAASRLEAAAGGRYEYGLVVWDPATGATRPAPPLPPGGRCQAVSPDGGRVAVATDAAVAVVEFATGRVVRTVPTREPVDALLFSADGRAVAGFAGAVAEVWPVADGAARGRVELPPGFAPVRRGLGPQGAVAAALSADGTCLATVEPAAPGAAPGGGVALWDVATGRARRVSRVTGAKILSLAFSRDGRFLAVGGSDGLVRVWEGLTGGLWAELRGAASEATAVAFSADGGRVAAGTRDGTVAVWDLDAAGPPAAPWEKVWGGLGAADPAAARAALRTLRTDPARAARTVRAGLVLPATDAAQTARWIADLDADTYAVRDAAFAALAARAPWLTADLRRAAAAVPSAEAGRRLDDLRRLAADPNLCPAVRAARRAVAELERMATPDATAVLRELTRAGWADTPAGGDARAALRRLGAAPAPR